MIIDTHCHVWPDEIAAKILANRPAGLEPLHNGTLDGLKRTMDDAGIDMAMCLGVAAVARTVEKTNEFIGSIDRTRFIPFGTVHPELSNEVNLASLSNNGIRGVKLHPLFQELSFADLRVIDLVRALADDGVVVITHAGSGGDETQNSRGAPSVLRAMIDEVPNLKLIACHFGGYHRLDEAERVMIESRAYLETSWPPRLSDLDIARVRSIITRHGVDRVVFGSDWPMADPKSEISAVRSLGLSADEEAQILGRNAANLLGVNL